MSLEKLLTDIKQQISLKNTTCAGDIVLVGTPQGFFYALVRDISPDYKKGWYLVSYTALVLPPVDVTWKLRPPQMTGEMFIMNGEDYFMQAIAFDIACPEKQKITDRRNTTPGNSGRVVPFMPRQ